MPTRQVTIPAGESRQLVPYDKTRTSLLIRLIEGELLWISTERLEIQSTGFLLLSYDAISFSRADGDEPEAELIAYNPEDTDARVSIIEGYGKAHIA